MNRRFAVLGLVLATTCGTGSAVAGQTAAPKAVPVVITPTAGQTSQTIAPGPIRLSYGEWRDYYDTQHKALMALAENAGEFSQAVQAQTGQTSFSFRVESVGPERTRIYLTQNGHPHGTFESTGFTVTTGASGTTITASGPVSVGVDGKMFTVAGLTVSVGPDGTSLRFSSTGK